MQIQVQTSAPEMSTGELITTRKADGLSWVLLSLKSTVGGEPYFMTCLCAARNVRRGRKLVSYYEWLSFRDMGRTFFDRSDALAYIGSKC